MNLRQTLFWVPHHLRKYGSFSCKVLNTHYHTLQFFLSSSCRNHHQRGLRLPSLLHQPVLNVDPSCLPAELLTRTLHLHRNAPHPPLA
jgi:hypothetical protein